MKIFIDSAGQDLFIALYDEHFNLINFKHDKKIIQKVEKITAFFTELLNDHKINIKNIKDIFINLGPGTFTGSRIALVFARTLCQLNNINLYTTNTFSLISPKNLEVKIISVDARGNKIFQAQVLEGELISEIEVKELKSEDTFQEINYDLIKEDFKSFFTIFKNEKDLLSISPIYAKNPQIGTLK